MSFEDYSVITSNLNSVLLIFFLLTPVTWIHYFFEKTSIVLWLAIALSTMLLVLSVVALLQGVLQVTYFSNLIASAISSILALIHCRKHKTAEWMSDDD